MIRLFTYGTLMRGEGNYHRMEKQTFLSRGRTEGRLFTNESYPYFRPGRNQGTVLGEIFEIDDQCLAGLDSMELNSGYTRETILVDLYDVADCRVMTIECQVYVGPERVEQQYRLIEDGNYSKDNARVREEQRLDPDECEGCQIEQDDNIEWACAACGQCGDCCGDRDNPLSCEHAAMGSSYG